MPFVLCEGLKKPTTWIFCLKDAAPQNSETTAIAKCKLLQEVNEKPLFLSQRMFSSWTCFPVTTLYYKCKQNQDMFNYFDLAYL